MSLLVHYTLKSADDHDVQVSAMEKFVQSLKSEGVAARYTCFSTDDPTRFVGVLEFDDNGQKQSFLDSKAFDAYRAAVGPTFANPPETTSLKAIASTRD
jgi:quinol monooxygenase YgiN